MEEHRLRGCVAAAILVVCAIAGCGKGKSAERSRDGGAAKPVATRPDAAANVAASSPDATPAPKLPPLGAPPTGMDEKLAAACDAGDGKACLAAAQGFAPTAEDELHLKEEDMASREEGTVRYAERACDLGLGDGCHFAAAHVTGYENPKRPALLRRGCDLGDLGACGDLAEILAFQDDTKDEGLALLEKACRADALSMNQTEHGTFCATLVQYYSNNAADEAKAKELLGLQCQQGYKVGCPCTEATVEKDCVELRCENGRCEEEEVGD
jgi:hypothetical protein